MSYTPPTTSPGNIWSYTHRSLKIVKLSITDTNTYSITNNNTAWTLLKTLSINTGYPNKPFFIRILRTQYTLDAPSVTGVTGTLYGKLVLGDYNYSQHSITIPDTSTFNDWYGNVDLVTTDSSGNINIGVYGMMSGVSVSYTAYLENITVVIIGEIII